MLFYAVLPGGWVWSARMGVPPGRRWVFEVQATTQHFLSLCITGSNRETNSDGVLIFIG